MVYWNPKSILGWGQVWLDKAEKAIAIKLFDPHSLAKFRINGVAMQRSRIL
jgi:predicted metalloendopeptidase